MSETVGSYNRKNNQPNHLRHKGQGIQKCFVLYTGLLCLELTEPVLKRCREFVIMNPNGKLSIYQEAIEINKKGEAIPVCSNDGGRYDSMVQLCYANYIDPTTPIGLN